jgi:hypothetical protein
MSISFKAEEGTSTDTSDDVVGRFRSGFLTSGGRPQSLDAFRVTTGDPDIAEAVSELMGADGSGVSSWETSTEEKLQVFTTTSEVAIIVEPASIKASLVLWSRGGKKIVETDGSYLIEDGKLTDNQWDGASLPMAKVKQNAKDGVGPSPSLQVYFRLAESPGLGKFKYFSGAWTAIDTFNAAESRVESLGGACDAMLSLEKVEFTAKDGTEVSYFRPSLKVLGLAA